MTLVLSLYLYEPPLFFLYIFLQHLKFIYNNVITQTSTYKISWSKYLYLTLSARIFTVFGHIVLEDRVLHKEAWVAKLLGTHLSIQVHKKVKFSW